MAEPTSEGQLPRTALTLKEIRELGSFESPRLTVLREMPNASEYLSFLKKEGLPKFTVGSVENGKLLINDPKDGTIYEGNTEGLEDAVTPALSIVLDHLKNLDVPQDNRLLWYLMLNSAGTPGQFHIDAPPTDDEAMPREIHVITFGTGEGTVGKPGTYTFPKMPAGLTGGPEITKFIQDDLDRQARNKPEVQHTPALTGVAFDNLTMHGIPDVPGRSLLRFSSMPLR